jgi:drug/metabolite transporter (DMT)-like permease
LALLLLSLLDSCNCPVWLVFSLALPLAAIAGVSSHDLIILALFALVNQVMGFGLFALGARMLPPMETALVTALDAPLAPLWVWLFLAETPSAATLIGGGIVLTAVIAHISFSSKP